MSSLCKSLILGNSISRFVGNFIKNPLKVHYTRLKHYIPKNLTDEQIGNSTISDVKAQLLELMGLPKGYVTTPVSRDHLQQYIPKAQSDLPPRKMSDSYSTAIVPLSSDVFLQEKYVSHFGSIRWGRLMEDMDLFAVWCTMNHIKIENMPKNIPHPYVIVTILVDEIKFTDYNPKPKADIRLSGYVTWVGKSSIEVTVWLEQKRKETWEQITRAVFLMAARNATSTGAAVVNPLVPENDEEKQIILEGEERKRRRHQFDTSSLFKTIPNETEQRLIHEQFLRTVDVSDLTLNRRNLPEGCVWMTDGQLNNLIFSHPEDRNPHNKIFGGFLMRHALELSWNTCYIYCKHRPTLLHISDIIFVRPVEIGSMLKMSSFVAYTEKEHMQAIVHIEAVNPRLGVPSTTNVFHYTYKSPEIVPEVVPRTYYEAMVYIDGRRHFFHVMGL